MAEGRRALAEFKTVAIVGVGLIGGSVAMALRRRRPGCRIVGVSRNPAGLRGAVRRGWLDAVTRDVHRAAEGADLVILSTTPEDILSKGAALLSRWVMTPDGVVSDVAGVKSPIVAKLGRCRWGNRFVGAHPMAGKERPGWRGAEASLFEGATCALTPDRRTSPRAVERVARFWRGLGARVIRVSPGEHDRAVALSSHLPHLISFSYSLSWKRRGTKGVDRALRAGSYRDMTRIAHGPPDLWASLMWMNRARLRDELKAWLVSVRELDRRLAQNPASFRKILREAAME